MLCSFFYSLCHKLFGCLVLDLKTQHTHTHTERGKTILCWHKRKIKSCATCQHLFWLLTNIAFIVAKFYLASTKLWIIFNLDIITVVVYAIISAIRCSNSCALLYFDGKVVVRFSDIQCGILKQCKGTKGYAHDVLALHLISNGDFII